MLGQELCHCSCILFMLTHTHRQSFDATQREPGIEGRGNTTSRILIELDRFIHLFIVQHQNAADDVTMSIDVLSGAMNDDVCSKFQWLLKVWTGEGVIDDDQQVIS